MKTTLFLILSCLITSNLQSQNADDLQMARNLTSPPSGNEYRYTYQGDNELLEFSRLLFSGYKYLISSQDGNSCSFQPSCSVYAMHAVESKGFTLGVMETFDRLTRCHPLNHAQYPVNPRNGLAIDSLHTTTNRQ